MNVIPDHSHRCYLLDHQGRVFFDLPKGWRLKNDLALFNEPSLATSERKRNLVDEALDEPIASKKLEEMVSPSSRVLLIVDDLARPTPQRALLPRVLDRLKKAGVKSERVTILVAGGTHRLMTLEEWRERFGPEVVASYRVVNHDCRSKDLVKIGFLRDGHEVKLNPLLFEADFRMALGNILPHPFSGFGGGAKIVMPGLCDFESARHHHTTFIPKRSMAGRIEDNPFFDETWAIARKVPLDYLLNSILSPQGHLLHCVAGEPMEAFRKGIGLYQQVHGLQGMGEADVTITSSFPHSIMPQVLKPLSQAFLATKRGGSIVLYSRVEGPLPHESMNIIESLPFVSENLLGEYARRRRSIKGGSMDMTLIFPKYLMGLSEVRVVWASPDVSPNDAKKFGFAHACTVEEALREEARRKPEAEVNLFPQGGYALPMVRD